MGAADLLQHLRAAGFAVSLNQAGGITIAPASRLTDADRQALRQSRAEVLALLGGSQPENANEEKHLRQFDGAPKPTTPEAVQPIASAVKQRRDMASTALRRPEGTARHEPSPQRDARRPHLARWVDSDDELERHLDRLDARDADFVDHRMCAECSHLMGNGRCLAATRGRIQGAGRYLEPLRLELWRCEGFGLRKGLT